MLFYFILLLSFSSLNFFSNERQKWGGARGEGRREKLEGIEGGNQNQDILCEGKKTLL